MTDPNNVVTTHSYDAVGRVQSTTVSGHITSYTYTTTGKIATVTRPRNPSAPFTTYTYDALDRLESIQDELGNTIHYTYDSAGLRTREESKDALGVVHRTQSYTYDVLGRLWRVVNPDGYVEYGYDAAGNRTSLRNARGFVTRQSFDSLDRLKQVVQPGDVQTSYTYNHRDRVASLTDANGHTTTYTYDDPGPVYQETSPDAGVTRYRHDEAGNLVSKTDARATTVMYAYDGLNRVTAIAYPGDPDVSFTYDVPCVNGRGRLCQAIDQAGTTSYAYNAEGQLTSETSVIGGVSYTQEYAYDANGNNTGISYPGGRSVHYTYGVADRVSSVSTTTGGRASTLASAIVHKPFGPLSGLTYGNGLTRTLGYDTQYRLTDLQTAGAQSLTYVPDPNGNVTTITDSLDPSNNKSFTYDALDRLETAGGPWGALGWSYDEVGNRLTQTAPEGSSSYIYQTGTNRLASVTGPQPHGFGYDAAGRINADNASTYAYNDEGRMESASQGGLLGQYAYDWQQRRASKQTAGGTRVFHHSPDGLLLSETDAAGVVLAEYVWLEGQPIAKIEAGVVRYVHADHLGSPARMTDTSGAVVWSLEARPFGDAATLAGPASLDLRFPGQYFDAETGLHQNWWRDYMPATGRYLQPDPLMFQDSPGVNGYYGATYYEPQLGRVISEDPSNADEGINPYAYVAANPLTYVDAFGLSRTGPPRTPPPNRIPPSVPPPKLTRGCPGKCGFGGSHVRFSGSGVLPNGTPTNECVYWIEYFDCDCYVYLKEIMIKCIWLVPQCGAGGACPPQC